MQKLRKGMALLLAVFLCIGVLPLSGVAHAENLQEEAALGKTVQTEEARTEKVMSLLAESVESEAALSEMSTSDAVSEEESDAEEIAPAEESADVITDDIQAEASASSRMDSFSLLIASAPRMAPAAASAATLEALQNDWRFARNNTSKRIVLTKYLGSEESLEVPATVMVDGEEYAVQLGNGSNSSNQIFAGTSVKQLTVEDGVIISNPNYLFYNAIQLESVDLTGADLSSATSMQGMFYGCSGLKSVNLHGVDAGKVTNVRYMFYQASNIEEVDLSDTDLSKVTSFAYSSPSNSYASTLFMGMNNLKRINFNNFNTESLTTAERMFIINVSSYQNTNHIEEIDVTNWNTKNVTNFYETFKYCGYNNDIVIKGLETLDVGNVKDFSSVFSGGKNIKDLSGVESWNMSSATNIGSIFSGCESITSLDLSKWDTSNVTYVRSAFVNCKALKDLDVSTWNTSNVTEMQDTFKGCASLEKLNLKSWTSEKVLSDYGMANMLGVRTGNSEYPLTPLTEITLNDNFKFFGLSSSALSPGLRDGYWHLKEGTSEETSKRYTPSRLYTAYNNGTTPGEGYTYDHTYVLTELSPAEHQYYARGWQEDNVWEVHYPDDKFKGYCINLHRASPDGYYDRINVTDIDLIDDGFLDSDDYGWEPLGSNMKEALITLIYYGWGNDADGIQERYGLSDHEFMLITQQAIWDFTDRYSNMPARDRSTPAGQAYYELISKHFSDIPNGDQLTLYLYESENPNRQNLLSISGLQNTPHAGVRVLKLGATDGDALEPLIGAEFTIYDSDGREVATIISDEDGYATKYNTDSIYGLPMGVYTVRETKAPRGYIKSNASYTFIIRKEDDNKIVLVGKLSGAGDEAAMIFENKVDSTVTGGGIWIRKTDGAGNALAGAKFRITDAGGAVVAEITSGANGIAMTGKKDLELGAEYTVTEISGVPGYALSASPQKVTLSEDGKYVTLTFTNPAKTGTAVIEATKQYNEQLSGGDFTFELTDSDGNVLTAKNDKNGTVSFTLEYTGADIGYRVYTLREVNGGADNITYDSHEEEIIVYISDNGAATLDCQVEYHDGEAVFTNRTVGKVTLTAEKVWDDENDKDGIRPESVAVKILANGTDTGKALTLSKANGWKDSVELDKYDVEGKEIVYTLEEVSVKEYKSVVSGSAADGFTITNSHTPKEEPPVEPETINISAKKVWDDENDKDKIRPDHVTIHLLANGEEAETIALNKDNGWEYTFTGLVKADNDGKEITYTVTEDAVKGYNSKITGDAASGYVVTNTHTSKPEEPKSPDKPKPSNPGSPKTGDDTNLGLWLSLMGGSLSGILAIAFAGKRKRYAGRHSK